MHSNDDVAGFSWYLTINFTHVNLSDARVLCDFPQNTAVTTADNQNFLRILVCKHWQVCYHLLIRELISLCDLNDTVCIRYQKK